MELLLREDISTLGKKGTIVHVKPGYGRNFLVPQRVAMEVNRENLRLLEVEKKRHLQMEAKKKAECSHMAKSLELASCTVEAKANEAGNLFGSVTYSMIAEAFGKEGFDLDPKDIELEDPALYPIKELGIYALNIRLHPEVIAKSKVWVMLESKENGE